MASNQSGPNERESLPEGASIMPKRRERLEALKARRASIEAPVGKEAPVPPGFGGAQGGGMGGLFGDEGGGRRAMQRKMVTKIYRLLTQTPDDGSGRVPETPFTKTGVARLMALLQERSQGGKGAKVAAKAIEFLSPGGEGEEAVSGASVEKLQMLARRTEQLRQRRGL